MDEKKEPEPTGGEVVSLDDARKRAEEKQTPAAPPGPDLLGNALQPIMAAIARELAALAGPDGTIKIDGATSEEETKAKTQALLRGLGQGLGDVLAQALGKLGSKVDIKMNMAPDAAKTTPPTIQPTPIRNPEPPPGADDPNDKKS